MQGQTIKEPYVIHHRTGMHCVEICDARQPHDNGKGMPMMACFDAELAKRVVRLLNGDIGDTARLDHLIEHHLGDYDYAEAGDRDARPNAVSALHFIFERSAGADRRTDVRAAIDCDIVVSAHVAKRREELHCGVNTAGAQ
jgi:hypothetical protein